jgi:CYTH domain-containing protein
MGIEIEKKFTVKEIPFDLGAYPYHEIEQGYLNVHPAIRVRREDDIYYMTYKGAPFDEKNHGEGIGQVEYNMPLDKAGYEHIAQKADGNVIRKKRYLIPLNEDAFTKEYLDRDSQVKEAVEKGDIKIELDVFKAPFEGRILAEVEFPSEEAARNYNPAKWFAEDVTGDRRYSNSQMSTEIIEK